MRFSILIPAIAIGVGLTGCLSNGGNRGLESVHQPVVRVNSYVFDADVSSGILTPSEMRRVSDWLDAMEVAYGDRVAIDDSSGIGARSARDGVAMLLSRKGLLLAQHAPITDGAIAPGRMRIVLTRSSARVPSCPDWSTRSNNDFDSTTTSNFGCASNSNLAAMVADASDLVRGQAGVGNDPNSASKAINAYRTAPPTGAGGLPEEGGAAAGSSGGGR